LLSSCYAALLPLGFRQEVEQIKANVFNNVFISATFLKNIFWNVFTSVTSTVQECTINVDPDGILAHSESSMWPGLNAHCGVFLQPLAKHFSV